MLWDFDIKDRQTPQKNYRQIYLMTIDAKFLYKLLVNQIQQHKRKDYRPCPSEMDLSHEYKGITV